MIDPNGIYNIIRCDRADNRAGGGVCVLLRKIFNLRRIPMSPDCEVLCTDSGCDILHFEILLKHVKFRIILFYRPPCPSRNLTSSAALVKLLSTLVDPHLINTTIILGDFNLPFIDWSNSCARSDGIHPKHIRILLNRKAAIWRVLRSSHSSELYIKYCNIAHQCKSAIYEYDAEREKNLLNANNLGAFYKFINKKLYNSSDIAPLYNNTGSLFPSDSDKANILNSYFESVFIKDDGNLPTFPSRLPKYNYYRN